jgi:hypothetical protein
VDAVSSQQETAMGVVRLQIHIKFSRCLVSHHIMGLNNK